MTTALEIPLRAPYKGLAPFDESDVDALLFFGRERETEIVCANALAARLTVLYGPSGVGKSSLLRAGVVHRLRRLAQTEPVAVACFSSWAGDPAAGIEEAVRGALTDAFGGDPGEAPGDLVDRLDGWSAALDARIVLILDQFEEHFLYHASGEGLDAFLPDLVTRPGLRVNVVIGIRDDELAGLDVFKARIPGLFGNYLRLDRMSREAGRAAIIGPLEQFNAASDEHVEIEPALVDAVLAEVALGRIDGRQASGGESGIETPYLQLVMQRVWEVERERRSGILRRSTLTELGGAQRVVEDHLARAMAALTPAQRDVAAGMFDYLVTPSGTKIAHGVSDLATFAHVDVERLRPVLAALAAQRILRRDSEAGAGGDRYEIYHDVLAGAVLDWKAEHEATAALERERAESHRRQRRLAIVAGISFAALALMTALTIYAYSARSTARHQATVAQAQRARAVHAVHVAQVARKNAVVARGQAVRRARQYRSLYKRYRATALSNAVLAHTTQQQKQTLEQQNTELDTANQQLQESNAALQQSNAALQEQTAKAEQATKVASEQTHETAVKQQQTLAAELLSDAQASVADNPATSVQDALRSAGIVTLPGTEGVLRSALLADHAIVRLPAGGPATQGVYSPDGSRVAVASSSGALRVYSVPDGRLLRSVNAGAPVSALAWSPDGQRLAVGLSSGSVQLRDAASGAVVHSGSAGAPVRSLAFSPGGSTFALAAGNTAQLWDAGSGLVVQTLPHDRAVTSVAYSDDGSLVLTTARQNTARVWDVATGLLVQPLQARSTINAAAFGPGGTLVATGSEDGTGQIWNARTGQVVRSLVGHGSAITSVAFSRTGNRVATASVDGTVREWTPADGLVDVIRGFTSGVVSVAFSPDGQSAIGLEGNGRAEAFGGAQLEVPLLGVTGSARSAAFSPDGTTAATVSGDGVQLWEPYGEPRLRGIHRGAAAATALAFDPAGAVLASGDAGGTVTLQKAHGGPLSSFGVGAPVVGLTWASNGTLLAAGADGALHLRAGGRETAELRMGAPIVAATLSPDGRIAAAAGKDGTVRVWRVGSAAQPLRFAAGGAPSSLAVDPAGKLIAAGVGNDAVLFDAATGRVLARLHGHSDAVTDVVFSPDGRLLASAGRDHDARIWNVARRALVAVLHRHTSSLAGVAFSADGRWLATAGAAKAGVWSAAPGSGLPGRFLFFARGTVSPLTAVAWSARGSELATAARDGSIRILDCRLCGTLPQLEALARRQLAGSR